MEPDGIGKGVRLTWGSPHAVAGRVAKDAIKLDRGGEPEAERGRGWRIHREYCAMRLQMEMEDGPSESACRCRFQITSSCYGQNPMVVSVELTNVSAERTSNGVKIGNSHGSQD